VKDKNAALREHGVLKSLDEEKAHQLFELIHGY
jgi:hypothetical protein